MTTATVTSNRAQTVVVDRGYHWRPIDASTPRSQKLQLINQRDGVAVYGAIGADTTWTHWAPLPSFAPAHQPRTDVDEWAGLPATSNKGHSDLIPPPEPAWSAIAARLKPRDATERELAAQRDELLEALTQTLAQCLIWQGEPNEWSCSIHKAVVEQARAAIAKAEGGEA